MAENRIPAGGAAGRPEGRGCGGRRQRRLPNLAASEAVVGAPSRSAAEASGFVRVGAHLKWLRD